MNEFSSIFLYLKRLIIVCDYYYPDISQSNQQVRLKERYNILLLSQMAQKVLNIAP